MMSILPSTAPSTPLSSSLPGLIVSNQRAGPQPTTISSVNNHVYDHPHRLLQSHRTPLQPGLVAAHLPRSPNRLQYAHRTSSFFVPPRTSTSASTVHQRSSVDQAASLSIAASPQPTPTTSTAPPVVRHHHSSSSLRKLGSKLFSRRAPVNQRSPPPSTSSGQQRAQCASPRPTYPSLAATQRPSSRLVNRPGSDHPMSAADPHPDRCPSSSSSGHHLPSTPDNHPARYAPLDGFHTPLTPSTPLEKPEFQTEYARQLFGQRSSAVRPLRSTSTSSPELDAPAQYNHHHLNPHHQQARPEDDDEEHEQLLPVSSSSLADDQHEQPAPPHSRQPSISACSHRGSISPGANHHHHHHHRQSNSSSQLNTNTTAATSTTHPTTQTHSSSSSSLDPASSPSIPSQAHSIPPPHPQHARRGSVLRSHSSLSFIHPIGPQPVASHHRPSPSLSSNFTPSSVSNQSRHARSGSSFRQSVRKKVDGIKDGIKLFKPARIPLDQSMFDPSDDYQQPTPRSNVNPAHPHAVSITQPRPLSRAVSLRNFPPTSSLHTKSAVIARQHRLQSESGHFQLRQRKSPSPTLSQPHSHNSLRSRGDSFRSSAALPENSPPDHDRPLSVVSHASLPQIPRSGPQRLKPGRAPLQSLDLDQQQPCESLLNFQYSSSSNNKSYPHQQPRSSIESVALGPLPTRSTSSLASSYSAQLPLIIDPKAWPSSDAHQESIHRDELETPHPPHRRVPIVHESANQVRRQIAREISQANGHYSHLSTHEDRPRFVQENHVTTSSGLSYLPPVQSAESVLNLEAHQPRGQNNSQLSTRHTPSPHSRAGDRTDRPPPLGSHPSLLSSAASSDSSSVSNSPPLPHENPIHQHDPRFQTPSIDSKSLKPSSKPSGTIQPRKRIEQRPVRPHDTEDGQAHNNESEQLDRSDEEDHPAQRLQPVAHSHPYRQRSASSVSHTFQHAHHRPKIYVREDQEADRNSVLSLQQKVGITGGASNYVQEHRHAPQQQEPFRSSQQRVSSVSSVPPMHSADPFASHGLSSYQLHGVDYTYDHRTPIDRNLIVINSKEYIKQCLIGKGGSSKVYRATIKPDHNGSKPTGELQNVKMVAIKIVGLKNADPVSYQSFCNEIEILKKLRGHERIIQLIDSKTDRERMKVWVVMELGEVDLNQLMNRQFSKGKGINFRFIKYIWEQMLEAVHTVHEAGVIHTDLKPANFVLVQGNVKIIDFGIAKAIPADTVHISRETQIGTANYMAPEALKMETDYKSLNADRQVVKMGRATDVWALGCILYQMIYGVTPFAKYEAGEKISMIRSERHQIDYAGYVQTVANKNEESSRVKVEPDGIECIKRCLKYRKQDRSSIPELLQDPFLIGRSKAEASTKGNLNSDGKLEVDDKILEDIVMRSVDFYKKKMKINGQGDIVTNEMMKKFTRAMKQSLVDR